MNRLLMFLYLMVIVFCLSSPSDAVEKSSLSTKEQLGKLLFFDTKLSVPEGQSCAVCHAPEVGFTGPDAEINKAGGVYEGGGQGPLWQQEAALLVVLRGQSCAAL